MLGCAQKHASMVAETTGSTASAHRRGGGRLCAVHTVAAAAASGARAALCSAIPSVLGARPWKRLVRHSSASSSFSVMACIWLHGISEKLS